MGSLNVGQRTNGSSPGTPQKVSRTVKRFPTFKSLCKQYEKKVRGKHGAGVLTLSIETRSATKGATARPRWSSRTSTSSG